ncbi:MAG: hypothetical protein HYW85_00095 [Deltaproteobacteria bacterium]|nr:hypothetical protein [Deltaproteobacteria bacterium]
MHLENVVVVEGAGVGCCGAGAVGAGEETAIPCFFVVSKEFCGAPQWMGGWLKDL